MLTPASLLLPERWTPLPDFPDFHKWGFSLAALNNSVYVTGGQAGAPPSLSGIHSLVKTLQSFSGCENEEILGPRGHTWVQGTVPA